MEKDLNELHNLANVTFQNVTNLTPALRQMVVNAKVYHKSVQATCNIAVTFIESMQNIADAATVSEGATKKLGEVLTDIIDAFKEIENMKLELTKLFINEVIIPLESRAEIEINEMKTTHKSYNTENKVQTELAEKAKAQVSKTRKKSMKKKKSTKLEEKEKMQVQTLDEAEKKLRQVREEGLRKALIEERRAYCFVAERMCTYGRGIIIYNNRISNFVNQKLPDWQQFISRPTELPPDSEDIIANPTGYKMGTVQRKISKKHSIKRTKSFNSSHFHTKYSTVDGRSSRGGSRPSLSTSAMNSSSNLSCVSISSSPSHKPPSSPGFSEAHLSVHPNASLANGGDASPRGVTPSPEPAVATYYPPGNETHHVTASDNRSEYANLVTLNKQNNNNNNNNNGSIAAQIRSHSFTIPKNQPNERKSSLNRTDSSVTEVMRRAALSSTSSENEDFSSKLAMIQSHLSKKLNTQRDPTAKSRLKAIYDHKAEDASQLNFSKDDIIVPICEETSGWLYGENEKTGKSGWFPAAYCKEVFINSSGEQELKPAIFHDGATGSRKQAPPVAKKTSHGKSGAARKTTVSGGPLTKPPRTYAEEKHDTGRSNSIDFSHITASSSMPHIVHLANQAKDESGHRVKHSDSFHHQDSLNSFDDSMDEESSLTSPPTSGESSPRKKSPGFKHHKKHSGFDSMPPPPPPPPPIEEDTKDDGGMKSDSNEPPPSPPPPPPIEDDGVIIIKNDSKVPVTPSPFVGISFMKKTASASNS